MTHSPNIPAGWYVDPQTNAQLRWWDGTQWLNHYAPLTPGSVPSVSTNASQSPLQVADTSLPQVAPPADDDTFTEKAQEFLRNPLFQGAALGAAGTALGVTGAVSIKKNKRTSVIFLFGLIAFAIGVFMLITNAGAKPAVPSSEATVMGTVVEVTESKVGFTTVCVSTVEFQVKGETFTQKFDEYQLCTSEVGDTKAVAYNIENGGYDSRVGVARKGTEAVSYRSTYSIIAIVGFIVAAWSGGALAIRAGSVAGGAALLFSGFHKATQKKK